MVMLDVPQKQKEQLVYRLIQLGIDYHGLMKAGRIWAPDGAISLGRKWTIMLAGLMLGEPGDSDFFLHPKYELWAEDTDTYYGTCGTAGKQRCGRRPTTAVRKMACRLRRLIPRIGGRAKSLSADIGVLLRLLFPVRR